MKEYKFLMKGTFQKEKVLIDEMLQLAKDGWVLSQAVSDRNGVITRIILERDKNRY